MELKRNINIFDRSNLNEEEYKDFLTKSYKLIKELPLYMAESEDINSLELAHLIPDVDETVLTVYLGINDAVCNKGLVTPFLPRHAHNNVFVFDPEVYGGKEDVPAGTIDAQKILVGFQPPNNSWESNWTYVMIEDPDRTFESLWQEKGYIDMIPSKFEDFTILTDPEQSMVCTFVDPKAFDHPVNKSRDYLNQARKRGEKLADQFEIPKTLEGETRGLVPVILGKGEKLYVANPDFSPCDHCWSNIYPENESYAVVNENSAVPLDLVINKPAVSEKYRGKLIPAKGSADMTTDWFYRGDRIMRKPILEGLFKG